MSNSEIARLRQDISEKPELTGKLYANGLGLADVAAAAQSIGYDIDREDLRIYMADAADSMLSDEQLAHMAAGGSTWTHSTIASVIVSQSTGAVQIVLDGGIVTMTDSGGPAAYIA